MWEWPCPYQTQLVMHVRWHFNVILTDAYVISTFNNYVTVTDFIMSFEMHQYDINKLS